MADDLRDLEFDVGEARRPGNWRGRVAALVGVIALLAVGVALAVANGADDPATESGPDQPAPDQSNPEPDAAEVDPAGRYDGLDSVRLPLEVTPDSDLVDGQVVQVRGAGFTPHAQVGLIQCAGVNGENGQSGDGGVGNCDLSNYVLGGVDAQGFVDMELRIHRYIATDDGEIDCARQEVQCAMAIGNINDYDESGVAPIWFDGNVDGVRSPFLTLDRTTGLRAGDPIEVTGANFTPGDSVRLSQCVIGGSYSFGSCFETSLVTDTVTVGADGTFVVTVTARREIGTRGIDCYDDPYGCRLAAHGTTDAPNPVGLSFDGSALPPGYTVTPSDGLVDGSVVRLDLIDMPADGAFTVSQCADGGPRGLFCADLGTVDVVGGNGGVDVSVVRSLTLDGDAIDCAEPGRACYLTLSGELAELVRGPLRFQP